MLQYLKLQAHYFVSIIPPPQRDGTRKFRRNARKFNRIEHGHHVKSPYEEPFSPRFSRSDWREAHEPKKFASRESVSSGVLSLIHPIWCSGCFLTVLLLLCLATKRISCSRSELFISWISRSKNGHALSCGTINCGDFSF